MVGTASGLYYSTDGKNWTPSEATGGDKEKVVFGGGAFMATYGAYYSIDGKAWTRTEVTSGCRGVTYADGYWLVGGNSVWWSEICVAAGGTSYAEQGLYYSKLY